MLTKSQSWYYNRAQRLEIYFDKNKDVISTYKAFSLERDAFLKNLGLLNDEIPDKGATGTGITEQKEEVKQQLAESLGDICSFSRAYAIGIKNYELLAEIDYPYSDILRMKDSDIETFATRVNGLLSPLLPDEVFIQYGVTEQDLDDMVTLRNSFSELVGQAAIIEAQNTVASQNIDALLAAINKNVEQFNLLIPFFKKKNLDFVKGYYINKKIINIGIHHSGIQGFITSQATGLPVENATINLVGTTKNATSSLTGKYQLVKMRPKEYKIAVSAAGYRTKTVIFKIIQGKISPLNIQL